MNSTPNRSYLSRYETKCSG